MQSTEVCSEPAPVKLALRDDPQSQKALNDTLGMLFDSQKLYGKEPEQLENTARLFKFALSEFSYDKISQAMRFFVMNYNEMPAPADIVTIIRRGNKPPLDRAVYVSISRKDAQHRTSEEWEYMRDYDRFALTGDA